MAASPWIKFYTSDFLNGVADLEADEIGVYTVILALIWDRGAPIADDPSWLARRSGTSTRRFNQIKAKLIGLGKIEIRNGMIGNHRAIAEVARRDAKSDTARKAALARWHGASEPELPLDEDDPPRARAHGPAANGRIIPAKKADSSQEQTDLKTGKPDQKPQKSAKTDDADASSPSRARAAQKPESRIISHPDSESGTPDPPGRLDDRDLQALVDASCEAAGYRPISPAQIDRAFRIVEEWRKEGIDFDDVVIPSIKAVVAESSDPTRTLGRFSARIRHEHARRKAKGDAGRPYVPPASPVLEIADEAPIFRDVRKDLLERMGPAAYSHWCNSVRFEDVADAGANRRPMRVHDNNRGSRLVDADRATIVRAVARAHGFTDVWT